MFLQIPFHRRVTCGSESRMVQIAIVSSFSERERSACMCRQSSPAMAGERSRYVKISISRIAALAAATALVATSAISGVTAAQPAGTVFPVTDFSQVQIEGAGHAIITIGSPAAVTVSGPADAIANLQVQVWFDTLEIEQQNDNASSSELVYNITVPSLSQIELEDNVSAEIDGLTVDALEISLEDNASLQMTGLSTQRLESQVEGNSSVAIAGNADSQQIEIEGNATFDALQTGSKTIEIQAQDNAHAKVRFTDAMTGQTEDAAVVEYMSEAGSVSIETDDGGRVSQLPFEALAA